MIIPFLNGILRFNLAPVTWILVFLNVIVLGSLSGPVEETRGRLLELYSNTDFVKAQGRVFSQFVERHREVYEGVLPDLAAKVKAGDLDSVTTLGQLAIRDFFFMKYSLGENYRGDQVEIKYWRKKLDQAVALQNMDPNLKFGLSLQRSQLMNWFSYQFVHGSMAHLIGNLFFLMIFGCAIERRIGSLSFAVLYLGGGAIAGGAFLSFSRLSSLPLVGASGSISVLMGFFLAATWGRYVKFMYMILPLRKYMGLVWLPSWVALLMWLIPDVAGYFGTVPEMGGVAHLAHLGGFCAGFLIGGFIYAFKPSSSWGANPRLRVFSVTHLGSRN